MLESMRKHAQGWIAKVILGGIILSFALWGIGDYFNGNHVETVATIDDEPIYHVEFLETYQRQLNTYSNMLGEQFSKEMAERLGVKEETLQTMINRRLMLSEASDMGLVVPDQAVLGTVQSDPAFQEAKGFSPARYQSLIRQMGFVSPRDYESYLRQSIMIDTLQRSLTDTATVSDEEVLEKFKAEYEKRVLTALVVNPDSLKKDMKVTDEQARAWYEAHPAMYRSPLKVELQVAEIDAKSLDKNVEISAEDVQQAYEARLADFTEPEKRRASHILVRVAKDASPDVTATAWEKISAAKDRIAKGESFADVAKDVSDDVTSSQGGDLGFFGRGAMVSEFENAAFGAMKVGDVSDIIQTQFGLHLIKLTDIQAEKIKPLAEVKDDIRKQLKLQAASDEAYQLSRDLDDALGMEDSLKAAATRVNLKVRDLGKLSTENVLADPLLGTSKELKQKAFSMMPGDAIEIQEINNGHFVALEVLNRIEPDTMAYDDVVKRVYEDVSADLAAKEAKRIAEEMLVAAKAGATIDVLAQKFAQPKFISKPVLRSGEGDDAAWLQGVLAASFATPESNWADVVMPTSAGVAIVYVQDVQAADEKAFEEKSASVRDAAIKAKGAVRFARWMASVRDRHEVWVNNKLLERL